MFKLYIADASGDRLGYHWQRLQPYFNATRQFREAIFLIELSFVVNHNVTRRLRERKEEENEIVLRVMNER